MNYKYTTTTNPVTFPNWFIGFDKLFDDVCDQSKIAFPPYDIIRLSEGGFAIDLACAGFKKSEIEVTLDKQHLIVKGKKQADPTVKTYMHNGIAYRNFTRTFTLEKDVEVEQVTMEDGILRIHLERVAKEENLPKKLEIK